MEELVPLFGLGVTASRTQDEWDQLLEEKQGDKHTEGSGINWGHVALKIVSYNEVGLEADEGLGVGKKGEVCVKQRREYKEVQREETGRTQLSLALELCK